MSQAFRDLLARETPDKRIISIQEVDDQLPDASKNTVIQYTRYPSRDGPWFGSASPHQTTQSIYLTNVQIADGEEQLAYCMNDFMEAMTEEQYKEHTFTFTQEQWDESPRTPPPVEEDNVEVNAEEEVVPDANEEADTVGNPDEKTFEEEAANLLNRRKNIILEGPPGTGKTYAMKGIVNALKEDGLSIGKEGKDDFAITMHPATSYEDFIEGLRPGAVAGEFDYSAGVFVEKVKHAIQYPLEQHVVLLDELNRCNVPRVLGDLLTTIESGKRTKLLDHTADTQTPENLIEYEGDCNFVVCYNNTTAHANGYRFGWPRWREQRTDGMIRYYVNAAGREVYLYNEERNPDKNYRMLLSGEFSGDFPIVHPINPARDGFRDILVFVFINGNGHPILDAAWARFLVFGGDRPANNLISVLGDEGERSIICTDSMRRHRNGDENCVAGNLTLSMTFPELECECNLPNQTRYWCNSCDSVWDSSKRTEITLPGSKKLFHVPNNLLVVGTMNTTDRSVAPLDAALRRRFVFLRVDRSKLSTEDINDLPAEGGSRELLRETQDLWEKLNKELEDILGKDATIGHSYLYELRTELKNEADPEKLENLVVEFWRYSVLPQVADLLDATGKASDIWDSIDLKTQFEALGLKMNTGKKKYRTFSRTIVELTEED